MRKAPLLSTIELRKQNRNRVYRQLVTSGPTTKQELAQKLNMSLPTLTQNLKELSAMGLVDDSETTDSTGGRRPRLITVVPDAKFALGAELSRGHIRLVALDLQQNQLAFQIINKPFQNTEIYGQELAAVLETFLDENALDRTRLLGVGLTLPGIFSADQRTIECAPTMGVRDKMPCRILGSIPYPTRLDNDATCGGFAEWWSRTDNASTAYLSISRGIGGAILIDGNIYAGTHHRSAEFGHMCIHPEGRECSCGHKGCLEAYCSAARISDDLDISLEDFFTSLEEGNSSYQAIWKEYLDDLAIALNNIHIMLDCDVIVGGSVTQFLPVYQEELQDRLRQMNPFVKEGNYVHFCRYHGRSICIGAAMRFTTKYILEI